MRTIFSNSARPQITGSSSTVSSLFVYGSLAPKAENGHFLAALTGRWQKAHSLGRLYPEGLPGTEGYPALDLTDTSEQTQGLLFSSRQLAKVWPALDAFEGRSYLRQVISVTLPNGQARRAYAYGYRRNESTE